MSRSGSVVTLQIGQCGNQVGTHLFHTLAREAAAAGPGDLQDRILHQFFREPVSATERAAASTCSSAAATADGLAAPSAAGLPIARAVLIDMEPKVIGDALASASRSPLWRYSPARTFSQQSGSANNWAFGYAVHGPAHEERMLDTVRREAECCDTFGAALLLQSLAGGTGSGVGTYVSERLRDEYPKVQLVNQVVWPYSIGEVIVQNLNALLSLAHLHAASAGLLVVQNDAVHNIAVQTLGIARPNFDDLNGIIATHLASVLLPAFHAVPNTLPPAHAGQMPLYNSADNGSAAYASPYYSPYTDPGHLPAWANAYSGSNGSTTYADMASLLRSATAQSSATNSVSSRCLSLSDITDHLFSHPSYRLSSLSAIPNVSRSAQRFEATTWGFVTRHLLQAHITPGHAFGTNPYSTNMGGGGVSSQSHSQSDPHDGEGATDREQTSDRERLSDRERDRERYQGASAVSAGGFGAGSAAAGAGARARRAAAAAASARNAQRYIDWGIELGRPCHLDAGSRLFAPPPTYTAAQGTYTGAGALNSRLHPGAAATASAFCAGSSSSSNASASDNCSESTRQATTYKNDFYDGSEFCYEFEEDEEEWHRSLSSSYNNINSHNNNDDYDDDASNDADSNNSIRHGGANSHSQSGQSGQSGATGRPSYHSARVPRFAPRPSAASAAAAARSRARRYGGNNSNSNGAGTGNAANEHGSAALSPSVGSRSGRGPRGRAFFGPASRFQSVHGFSPAMPFTHGSANHAAATRARSGTSSAVPVADNTAGSRGSGVGVGLTGVGMGSDYHHHGSSRAASAFAGSEFTVAMTPFELAGILEADAAALALAHKQHNNNAKSSAQQQQQQHQYCRDFYSPSAGLTSAPPDAAPPANKSLAAYLILRGDGASAALATAALGNATAVAAAGGGVGAAPCHTAYPAFTPTAAASAALVLTGSSPGSSASTSASAAAAAAGARAGARRGDASAAATLAALSSNASSNSGGSNSADEPEWLGFAHPSLYSSHNPAPLLCGVAAAPFNGDARSGAVWAVSQRVAAPLSHVVGRAWQMFRSAAYTHHYTAHGVEAEDFVAHFATLEGVVQAYQNM